MKEVEWGEEGRKMAQTQFPYVKFSKNTFNKKKVLTNRPPNSSTDLSVSN